VEALWALESWEVTTAYGFKDIPMRLSLARGFGLVEPGWIRWLPPRQIGIWLPNEFRGRALDYHRDRSRIVIGGRGEAITVLDFADALGR
jgi:hypothetical protein